MADKNAAFLIVYHVIGRQSEHRGQVLASVERRVTRHFFEALIDFEAAKADVAESWKGTATPVTVVVHQIVRLD